MNTFLLFLGCYLVTGGLFSLGLWVFDWFEFRTIGEETGESDDTMMCFVMNWWVITLWPFTLAALVFPWDRKPESWK